MTGIRNAVVSVALAALAIGCGPGTAPPATSPTANPAVDACADRLHDFCGRILLYSALRGELPKDMGDLLQGEAQPPPTCPSSGKPYVYDRDGLEVSGLAGRLIIYDAEPCHSGARWGVLVEPEQAGKPLVARVVRAMETAIIRHGQHVGP